MEFFFPEDNLERTSPEDTKILSLSAEPYEDGRRVRVNIEMSLFEKRPHLEVNLTDSNGEEISTASFVEPMTFKLEFTLHLRTKPAAGPLRAMRQPRACFFISRSGWETVPLPMAPPLSRRWLFYWRW